MLEKYDVPIPQVKLKLTVYEVYSENDEKLGLDFQAWKNNDGMDFFSGGARFRDNWQAVYGGNLEHNNNESSSLKKFLSEKRGFLLRILRRLPERSEGMPK